MWHIVSLFTFIFTIGMLQYLSDGRIFTFCNYYQGSASSSGDIPYQCRANPPNPLFLSDRCITIRIGTPHHTLPPAAKSVLPINTRPALNCNSGPLFHNSFYSIVLPMIKYNPRNTFWIYTWESSISFSSPGKHNALEENGKLWFRWFTSLWLSATTGRGPSGNLSSRTNQS